MSFLNPYCLCPLLTNLSYPTTTRTVDESRGYCRGVGRERGGTAGDFLLGFVDGFSDATVAHNIRKIAFGLNPPINLFVPCSWLLSFSHFALCSVVSCLPQFFSSLHTHTSASSRASTRVVFYRFGNLTTHTFQLAVAHWRDRYHARATLFNKHKANYDVAAGRLAETRKAKTEVRTRVDFSH